MGKLPPRDGYGKALLRLCGHDPKVVVLDADVAKSTRTDWVRERFPGRFLNMGVSEQDMAATAAGLAMTGMIPYVSTYSAFLVSRAYDQIRSAICQDNLGVKLAGAHAGFSTGQDGSVHQCLEDLAVMRALPNMTVIAPCDALQVEKAAKAMRDYPGPCYLRFGREPLPVATDAHTPFEIGKARMIRDGCDVAILACGALVYEAALAAEVLSAQGISALVADIHTVKPLDRDFVLWAAAKTRLCVTAEEHQISGGLGGAVCELLSGELPTFVCRVGVGDAFGESALPDALMKKHGLCAENITAIAMSAVHRNKQYPPPDFPIPFESRHSGSLAGALR